MVHVQKKEVPRAAQGYELLISDQHPLRFIFHEDSQAAAYVTQSMHLTSTKEDYLDMD